MPIFYAAELKRSQPSPSIAVARSARRPWGWLTLACALLCVSGLIRTWQSQSVENAKDRVIRPLFPLVELPKQIGAWRAVEGTESALEPQISRIAGSVDSLVRAYVEQNTGVVVTVLILYGRAEQVVLHTPEVCYPAAGYAQTDDVFDVALPSQPIPSAFRSLIFRREGGTNPIREEVYYAFRHDGQWSPSLQGNWRKLRFSPAVFKVQIRRPLADKERRVPKNLSEQFLIPLVQELEKRITAVRPPSGRSS